MSFLAPVAPAPSTSFEGPPALGRVALVGAGPGDPELITRRGLRYLRQADAVVFDRLIHPSLLQETRPGTYLVDVGKSPGKAGLGQEGIERLLVRQARRGAFVVRLKGGDPFVFGRGGEEVAACRAAGVACEVVPGITAAAGAPAAAGIPLTHRGAAASFAVIAGQRAGGRSPDWASFAAIDTLVILMGVARLGEIRAGLVAAGREASTPVALIQRASYPDQRTFYSSLGELSERAAAAGARAPATLVVGEVVRLGPALGSWLARAARVGGPIVPPPVASVGVRASSM